MSELEAADARCQPVGREGVESGDHQRRIIVVADGPENADGERFSDEDVVNHMIFVLMAAHDTSTATLSMMAYFLAKHPDWQHRLREEAYR